MNINKSHIDDLIELSKSDDPYFVRDLLDSFVKEYETQYLKLLEAHSTLDLKIIEQITHKLKSSAGLIGLKELSELALLIMDNALDHKTDNMGRDIEMLNKICHQQVRELREYLNSKL